MTSSVESIVPLYGVNCLQFDQMAIDLWRVEARSGATGHYVSPDPRFVVLFDGATMTLNRKAGETDRFCNAFFVPAGLPLYGRIGATGYLEHIDIHIPETRLRQIVDPSTKLKTALFLSDSVELRRLCALLADECRRPERPLGYSESLANSVIHEIFHLGSRKETPFSAPAWLEDVKNHAASHLESQLSIEELAMVAGMSRSRFSRRFKELSGLPPHQWVMALRIERAQRLLIEGVVISQVAHDTGFADQAHFSRHFRRTTGLSPGKWAKRHVSSNH